MGNEKLRPGRPNRPAGWKLRDLVVTERGRYVWDPILNVVYFKDKGKQRERYSIPLGRFNTWNGAMRAIARDILKHHHAD